MVAKKTGDGASVNASDTRDAVAFAPLGEGFHSEVMRVFLREVGDDDGGALDALRFKIDTNVVAVDWGFVGRHAVVADEGCSEHKDLPTV